MNFPNFPLHFITCASIKNDSLIHYLSNKIQANKADLPAFSAQREVLSLLFVKSCIYLQRIGPSDFQYC